MTLIGLSNNMDISQYRVLYYCLKAFHGLFSYKLTILDLFDGLLRSAGILQIMQAHNATLCMVPFCVALILSGVFD